jgi:methylated-DNA-[protein]-cysteine S-methyltransferase
MKSKNKLQLQHDAVLAAPFGAVAIYAQGMQIVVELLTDKIPAKQSENPKVQRVAQAITAYLANATNDFNLPLVLAGTDYQRRVWQAIAAIPCGQVLTYGEIAAQIGSGPRAVANACGANNLPLLVPCHRVVAKNGIGGFMQGNVDGLAIKKWLLRHEGFEF